MKLEDFKIGMYVYFPCGCVLLDDAYSGGIQIKRPTFVFAKIVSLCSSKRQIEIVPLNDKMEEVECRSIFIYPYGVFEANTGDLPEKAKAKLHLGG